MFFSFSDRKRLDKFEPMKPAAPVTKIRFPTDSLIDKLIICNHLYLQVSLFVTPHDSRALRQTANKDRRIETIVVTRKQYNPYVFS